MYAFSPVECLDCASNLTAAGLGWLIKVLWFACDITVFVRDDLLNFVPLVFVVRYCSRFSSQVARARPRSINILILPLCCCSWVWLVHNRSFFSLIAQFKFKAVQDIRWLVAKSCGYFYKNTMLIWMKTRAVAILNVLALGNKNYKEKRSY